MDLYLGIDGGGTKTRAVLVDSQGKLVGQGMAGPSNYNNVGIEAAIQSVSEASLKAAEMAGMNNAVPQTAFLGLAGIKSREDIAQVTAAAERRGIAPAGKISVANDLHNALAGGLMGGPGIALIAGTGTNCLGQDASGKTAMCGGWGWILDDEGGGMGIALAAFRAVARAADGRAPTTNLMAPLLQFLDITDPSEIPSRIYGDQLGPEQIAGFAPVVERCAEEGDSTSQRILLEGADSLAQLVAGASRKLDFPSGPEVVILGSCGSLGAFYPPLIKAAILKACNGARIVEPRGTTVQGAALNALRIAGFANAGNGR